MDTWRRDNNALPRSAGRDSGIRTRMSFRLRFVLARARRLNEKHSNMHPSYREYGKRGEARTETDVSVENNP